MANTFASNATKPNVKNALNHHQSALNVETHSSTISESVSHNALKDTWKLLPLAKNLPISLVSAKFAMPDHAMSNLK